MKKTKNKALLLVVGLSILAGHANAFEPPVNNGIAWGGNQDILPLVFMGLGSFAVFATSTACGIAHRKLFQNKIPKKKVLVVVNIDRNKINKYDYFNQVRFQVELANKIVKENLPGSRIVFNYSH